MGLGDKLRSLFLDLAARTPIQLAQEFMGRDWYNKSGHFKYPVGSVLDGKTNPDGTVTYWGYGKKPFGWRVVEHLHGDDGDGYVIETQDGDRQKHFKWNIEFQFTSRSRQETNAPRATLG